MPVCHHDLLMGGELQEKSEGHKLTCALPQDPQHIATRSHHNHQLSATTINSAFIYTYLPYNIKKTKIIDLKYFDIYVAPKCTQIYSSYQSKPTGGCVLFSSENAKGIAFSENINTKSQIHFPQFCMFHLMSNTPSQGRRHQPKQHLRQPKQQVCPILICAVFVAMQFLTQIYALFWRTIYRQKSAVAKKKKTNMRYA